MEKEKQNKQNKPGEEKKQGYIIIPNYFLREWVKVLGVGPALLYLQLLSYCHKEKDLAWPSLATLGKKMQFTPKSITKFHRILLKHGLIKKISKGKTPSGNFRRNIYQVTPLHMVKNTLSMGNNFPHIEEKITPNIGKKLPTNNTNLNSTNSTTTNGEKDAAVAVDFKKIKEKGDLSACGHAQAEEKMQAIKERMVELDFKEESIEKILKEYSTKKIDEKLDLLMERKNIQNPAGWLRTALKNDYRDEEQESRPTYHPHLNPPPSRGRKLIDNPPPQRGRRFIDCPSPQREEKFKETFETDPKLNTSEWTSREKALEAIKLIQDNLSACISPIPSGKRARVRKNVN